MTVKMSVGWFFDFLKNHQFRVFLLKKTESKNWRVPGISKKAQSKNRPVPGTYFTNMRIKEPLVLGTSFFSSKNCNSSLLVSWFFAGSLTF
jgi:hypothetical protein